MSKPTLHRSFRSFLTLTASALIATSSTHAALVGYENFDGYTAGNPLNGQTGGAGWPTSSAWSAVSGVNVSSEAITYDLDGETLGSGNALKLTGNSTNAFVRANPVTGGQPVFVSFIFQIKGGTTGSNVSGTIFTGWQADDANPSISVDSIGYLGNSGKAGARVNNQSTSFGEFLKFGHTYLCVIKYAGWNNGAYQTTQVWINPTRADENTTDPAITQTETESTGGSSGFLGLRVRTYGLSSSDYYLADEIRIGTTWDDVVSPAPRAPLQFTHPGITVDTKDLIRLRDRILAGREPQASAWSDLVANSPGQPGYQAQVTPIIDCISGTTYSIHNDSRALLDLALQWYVTGDEDYADTAIAVMDAWSGTLQQIRTLDDPDTYHATHILHVAWTAHHFAEAAEIIRHTYKNTSGNPIWPADKIARFETMLKTKFYPHLPGGMMQNGNWEASIIHSIMAIGIFTNDAAMFERGAVMLRGPGRGAIGTYIYASGQCQETTRKTDSGGIDLIHPQMGIGDILQACEMAWKQGADLYSAYPDPATGSPRMVLGMEYTAGLTLGEPRPLDGGGTIQYINPPVGAPRELLETGHNHYVHRMGYTLPWTTIAVEQRRENNLYGHNRCALTHGDLSVFGSWPFATGSLTSLSHFNWSGWGARGAATATTYTSTVLPSSGTSTPRLGIHSVTGANGDPGVLFAHSGGTSTPTASRNDRFVITTDTGTLSVSPDGLNTIVWKQASSNPATFATRVLVKSGGQWYASAQTYTVSQASSSGNMTNAETKLHDLWGPSGLGTTQWKTITFGNGQAISLGANNVSTAIGTTITGLGLLITTDDAFNRATFIDDVRLTSFP
jgi:hypothetical protein